MDNLPRAVCGGTVICVRSNPPRQQNIYNVNESLYMLVFVNVTSSAIYIFHECCVETHKMINSLVLVSTVARLFAVVGI